MLFIYFMFVLSTLMKKHERNFLFYVPKLKSKFLIFNLGFTSCNTTFVPVWTFFSAPIQCLRNKDFLFNFLLFL